MLIRVAIDASGAISGGAIRFLSQICPVLAETRKTTTFYLLSRSSQFSSLPALPSNFEWIKIPDKTAWVPFRLLWLQAGLPRVLKRLQADVLLAASDLSTFRPPCPMILMVHNFNPFSPSRGLVWRRKQLARMAVHRWLIRRTAQSAARVLFVSQWSQQEIAPKLDISADRTALIYHGVDKEFTFNDEAVETKTRPKFVLVVSEVLEHKNLLRAVEAYCKLAQHTADQVNLVIAGAVTSQALKKQLEAILSDRGLLDRVNFTGFIPKEELTNLYRQAELLLFPSLVETFGLPLIEAMASGLPVVTSRASAMPEICGDAACYFDPLDVPSITQAMTSVLTDQALRESLSQKGLRRAAKFSWNTAANSLLHHLELAVSDTK